MKAIIFICITFLFLPHSNASDKNGDYAIKGIGGVKCSTFTEAKDKKDNVYLQFGGWIEGFVSASNKNLTNTYDIAPWQTTETLATIIYTSCKKRPDIAFAQVLNQLEKQLLVDALKIKSSLIQLNYNKFSLHIPEMIYVKSIKKLTVLKFIGSNPTKLEMNKAFLAYQKSKNLPLTGLPDQYTLWNLLAE